MGYSTHYTLQIDRNCDLKPVDTAQAESLIAELRIANEEADYCLDTKGMPGDAGKWYKHEEDMLAFSELHPDFIFTLSGKGESGGDLWKKYFLNGKLQRTKAELRYEVFSRSALEKPKLLKASLR